MNNLAPSIITLTCPSCGAKLKLVDGVHLLACRNCGNEHMVHRDGGSIYLAPIAQDVRGIRLGVDKTAAELAVARLTREMEVLENEKRRALARKDSEWAGGTERQRSVFGLGLLILLFAWMSTADENPVLPSFLFGLSVAILIIALVMYTARRNKIFTLLHGEIQRVDSEMTKRSPSLEKNRHIAES
jgi:hypothetical protein